MSVRLGFALLAFIENTSFPSEFVADGPRFAKWSRVLDGGFGKFQTCRVTRGLTAAEEILDLLSHPLVLLARQIDWGFLDGERRNRNRKSRNRLGEMGTRLGKPLTIGAADADFAVPSSSNN
jgi:hypothetical protein